MEEIEMIINLFKCKSNEEAVIMLYKELYEKQDKGIVDFINDYETIALNNDCNGFEKKYANKLFVINCAFALLREDVQKNKEDILYLTDVLYKRCYELNRFVEYEMNDKKAEGKE